MAVSGAGAGDALSLPTALHPTATATTATGGSPASRAGSRAKSAALDIRSWTAAPFRGGPGRRSTAGSSSASASASPPGSGSGFGFGLGLGRRASSSAPRWWKVRLFRGMINDVRRRSPYYLSDWTDAWDYRVVPATVYMYFANILPALAFSLDMFTKTHMQYGVNEVLLASVLGAVVFSFLACQPLVIVGVTGPITVFNYTVYDIMSPTGTNYLAFMCWIGLWSLVLHWVLAVTNACNWLRYVTRFPCDIFGFYVACIYLQKGVQVLERLGAAEPFYLSVLVAVLVFMVAYLCGALGRSSLFSHRVRVFLKDYGTPLTVVFFSGFVHIGRMARVELEVLPTSRAFFPTSPSRGWLVDFWNIRVSDVFLALPFAVLLTVLFYFDHNVSSLIAQGTEFPLRKPAGFHWDLFLLGLTTGVAGLLGLPFPNGLIPQAPFHTEALCVTEMVADEDERGGAKGHFAPRATHVVEQRASNLAQGLLTLGTMSGPLLIVLHLIPQGVLAGLFFVMGVQALEANGITAKLLFLCREAALTPGAHPLRRAPRRAAVWAFVAVELAGFGATFAITQTVAAVGFPVFILLLIPVRALVLPRFFESAELALLDAPTASPFTMESVGGIYGGDGGEAVVVDAAGGSGSGSGSGSGRDGDDTDKAAGGGRGLFRSGDNTTVPSEAASVLGGARRKSEEELAERGEGGGGGLAVAGMTTRRRPSASAAWEGRAGGGGGVGDGGGIEMQRTAGGMSSRRSQQGVRSGD